MPELQWEKQPLTRELARNLRAATRRAPSLDGHTFRYGELKELWAAEGHVVLTHSVDPVWQYWSHAPEGGWAPVSIHPSRQEAQATAEGTAVSASDETSSVGDFLLARFPGGNWIRTRIQSRNGMASMTAIYQNMGCEVREEHVQ